MFSVADFPAGDVSVTVYSDGVPLGTAQLQYYSMMEEVTCLLSRVVDPAEFMCQVRETRSNRLCTFLLFIVVRAVFEK